MARFGTGSQLQVYNIIKHSWISLIRFALYSTTFVDSVDGNYGSLLYNGSFNGIIGMLTRGEVDLGLTGFSLTKSRAEAADFLHPIGSIW